MAAGVSGRSRVANPPRVVVSKPHAAAATDPARTVVALGGELDAAALNTLVEDFDRAIAADDANVVVDLADVDFIGAAWIGALVRSYASLRLQDRELTVRAPSHVVVRLLDLCGLTYLIEPIDAVRAP
jgi:anti-sigma B factor antagonist